MKFLLTLISCISIFGGNTEAAFCMGCTPLDTLTFEKVVAKFKTALVKFDKAFPYGDKHDEFEKVAKGTAEVHDFLVGEVQVKDYANKDNQDLADKYEVKAVDFPVVKLFKGVKDPPITYNGTFKRDDIIDWLKTNGVYIGLPGRIQNFDEIAAQFINDTSKRVEILDDVKVMVTKGLESTKLTEHAQIYVKVMDKIVAKGDEFVDNEIKRVENLRSTKASKENKERLEKRLNILQAFKHEEL